MNDFVLPPGAQPIGTPSVVTPVRGAGYQPQGNVPVQLNPNTQPIYVQGQQPVQLHDPSQGPVMRPEILDQMIAQQNVGADPQLMAQQANEQRIEQLIQDSNNRQAQQADQLNTLMGTLAQQQQASNDLARQQLEFQRQQAEAQRAANQPANAWDDPSLQLDAETLQTYEDTLPVMDKVARRNALLAAHETVGAVVGPELQALRDQVAALQTSTQAVQELAGQQFAAGLQQIAGEYGIDLQTIDSEPGYVQYRNTTSNALTGTTIGDDIDAALKSGDMTRLMTIRAAFKNYATQRDGQQQQVAQAELPDAVGGARVQMVDPSVAQAGGGVQMPQGQPQANDSIVKANQLEAYRKDLMVQLRTKRIGPAEFQQKVTEIETAMDTLIQTQ